MKQNVNEYINAIKMMLEAEGLEAANIANHKALESKIITLEQFQSAARILAKVILDR